MATPMEVIRRDRVGSTQDEARRGFAGRPLLVSASGQDAGRGRNGAEWLDADRALAASIAFRPNWPVTAWPRLTLVAGLAALDILPSRCGLKWPNDLMIDDGKVGGILSESSDGLVVVGLGLNIFWGDPPAGMAGVHDSDPGDGHGGRIAERWAEALLARADRSPDDWGRSEYLERCVTIGHEVTWSQGGTGKAVGISADGELIVATPEGERTVASGEVTEVRRA